MTDMNFADELKSRTLAAEKAIQEWLPSFPGYPGNICDAMVYSVNAGGKRLRPVLLLYSCEAFGGKRTDAEPFMAAMEFIHTASLIHDDLPAIDNDDLRRGKPTVHRAFSEAAGILSGDALLNYAYEVIFRGILTGSDRDQAVKAAAIIASKSGLFGMLGGQGLDVESEKGTIKEDGAVFLDTVISMKTSALIEASLMSGAALAGADDASISLLEKIGRDTGMAFQIRDDILDIIGTDEKLGKNAHSDERNQKETYISLLGLKKAEQRVKELTASAVRNAKKLECDSTFLEELILYLCEREY